MVGTQKNGDLLTESTRIISSDLTLYLSWQSTGVEVACINNTTYDSLQEAINNASNNKQTSIYLLKDTAENVEIPSNKNIVLYLEKHTITPGTNSIVTIDGIDYNQTILTK